MRYFMLAVVLMVSSACVVEVDKLQAGVGGVAAEGVRVKTLVPDNPTPDQARDLYNQLEKELAEQTRLMFAAAREGNQQAVEIGAAAIDRGYEQKARLREMMNGSKAG